MTLRGLLHCHTRYSADCLVPPEAYLWYAQQAKLDFVCITDHETLRGARHARLANRDRHLEVVVGAQYQTDRGALIGLFLREEIRVRQWHAVIDAIHDQGGLVVLPSPMVGHQLGDDLWAAVDLVETYNARLDATSNQLAFENARAWGKPEVCGADVHTLWELYANGTLLYLDGTGPLRERLLTAPRAMARRSAASWVGRWGTWVSQARAWGRSRRSSTWS